METPNRPLRNLYLENASKLVTPAPGAKNKDNEGELIGYGTGVHVFRMKRSLKNGQMLSPWAVKRVSTRAKANDTNVAQAFNARIQEEAEILRKLSHPNIVGYRGVVKVQEGMNALALECLNTSLGTILEERYEEEMGPLPARFTKKFILDISAALDYLHTKAKLLHGDLKSFNILVKGEFEICKLCDFGVSLPLNDEGVVNFVEKPELCYVGTDLWSAPEALDSLDTIDYKADIFSFGLIIYETIALVPPHTAQITVTEDSFNTSEDSDNVDLPADVSNAVGTRPELPQALELDNEYDVIITLFLLCTNELPEDRPTAEIIHKEIEKAMSNEKGKNEQDGNAIEEEKENKENKEGDEVKNE